MVRFLDSLVLTCRAERKAQKSSLTHATDVIRPGHTPTGDTVLAVRCVQILLHGSLLSWGCVFRSREVKRLSRATQPAVGLKGSLSE